MTQLRGPENRWEGFRRRTFPLYPRTHGGGINLRSLVESNTLFLSEVSSSPRAHS